MPRDANQVGPVTGEMVVVGRPAMCVGGMTEEARASVLVRVEIEGGMRGGERVIVAGLLDSMRLGRRHRCDCPTCGRASSPLPALAQWHFPMFSDLKPAF